jgi:hypothetical protein
MMNYALHSHIKPFLQGWVFEGSANRREWFFLDAHSDVDDNDADDIDANYRIATFTIDEPRGCKPVRVK